jgi:hypothetical protein
MNMTTEERREMMHHLSRMTDCKDLCDRESTIVFTESEIKAIEEGISRDKGLIVRLSHVLHYAVQMYGKPGGPLNVPSTPGTWIAAAREVLEESPYKPKTDDSKAVGMK